MRKKRVSSSKRTVRGRKATGNNLKVLRFIGVSLAGGKTEKTCVCVLDYYPEQKRLFLNQFNNKVNSVNDKSGDDLLLEFINRKDTKVKFVAMDAPLSLPHSFTHKCGGITNCKSEPIKWHWKHYKKIKRSKKTHKLFTPYTERCVESYITHDLEEPFPISHALGANAAPMTARAQYLQRHINKKLIEFYPKLSTWRIGQYFKVSKGHLRLYKHSLRGETARQAIVDSLLDSIFIYQQDIYKLITKPNYFDAFMGSLTAYLKHNDLTEKPPKDFPSKEGWIEFPVKDLQW